MKKAIITLGALFFAFLFALIIYHYWIFRDAAIAAKVASFCASLATICASLATLIGVIWAIIKVNSALQAYKNDHSMRKQEILNKFYERFLEDDLYELYEKIKRDWRFPLNNKNKKTLNKIFTLFDEIYYFKDAKLFDDELWEYFACEIVNLYHHKDVQEFLKQTGKQYKPENDRQKNMMPFTGFEALVKDLPDDCWPKGKPNFEEVWPKDD